MIRFFIFFFLCLPRFVHPSDLLDCSQERSLFHDLLIVDAVDKKLKDKMPVYYNNLLYGGYFNMPSALMGQEGEFGAGFSYVPPYRNYNIRVQITDRVEFSGNYRIFNGIEDGNLSPYGFGDFSDKGANLKFCLIKAEDSQYNLPAVSVGFEDFMGTCAFKSQYIVFSQVLLKYDLELTLGYGLQRIRGFFGGASYMPFRKKEGSFLQPLAFQWEYDATPYQDENIEKHPGGREVKSKVNFGAKYRLFDLIDMSIGYVRGKKIMASGSVFYNLGETKGLVPKISDPLPFKSPSNKEPIGIFRSEGTFSYEWVYAFKRQGFKILKMTQYISKDGKKGVAVRLVNCVYRLEKDLKNRLNHLILNLSPEGMDEVTIVLESFGVPVQNYVYPLDTIREIGFTESSCYQLGLLAQREESRPVSFSPQSIFFERKKERINVEFLPKVHNFFGSSTGKFKYSLGVQAGINGFLPGDFYYSVVLGYNFLSCLYDINDTDRLNPSQLLNVNTDIVNYYKQRGITVDQAYVQKNMNFGKGVFCQASLGYFGEQYGGFSTEFLYYPVNSSWAVGVEGAVLKKRQYKGLGFSKKIRQLVGYTPTYRKFTGSQYFLHGYYDWKEVDLTFHMKGGRFLARDYGIRYEVGRMFPSGIEVSLWYTRTNGNDKINGQIYYDKGIAVTVPLDIFYTHSCQQKVTQSMSAWLRDVGFSYVTGENIYNIVHDQRER